MNSILEVFASRDQAWRDGYRDGLEYARERWGMEHPGQGNRPRNVEECSQRWNPTQHADVHAQAFLAAVDDRRDEVRREARKHREQFSSGGVKAKHAARRLAHLEIRWPGLVTMTEEERLLSLGTKRARVRAEGDVEEGDLTCRASE